MGYASPYNSRADLLFRAGLPVLAIAAVTALLIVGLDLPALRTLALRLPSGLAWC